MPSQKDYIKTQLRLPPDIHQFATDAAKALNPKVSMNEFIILTLKEKMENEAMMAEYEEWRKEEDKKEPTKEQLAIWEIEADRTMNPEKYPSREQVLHKKMDTIIKSLKLIEKNQNK